MLSMPPALIIVICINLSLKKFSIRSVSSVIIGTLLARNFHVELLQALPAMIRTIMYIVY